MAQDLDTHFADSTRLGAAARRNPLNNTREPSMGRLALVPLGAAVLFAAVGWFGHERVEQRRMQAVAAAVVAEGHAAPVHIEPMRGDECWRAREGFAWKTADASGWACAGPGGEVRLQAKTAVLPQAGG